MFCCGIEDCGGTGSLEVLDTDWRAQHVAHCCPQCGQQLLQTEDHFEVLNMELQRERVALAMKPGPLTKAERYRLREIHEELQHQPADEYPPEKESLIMRIASSVMAKVRNERKH